MCVYKKCICSVLMALQIFNFVPLQKKHDSKDTIFYQNFYKAVIKQNPTKIVK